MSEDGEKGCEDGACRNLFSFGILEDMCVLLSANLFTLPVFRGIGFGPWSMGSSHRGFIALWK